MRPEYSSGLGDVEVHYLTELGDWDRWATWDMEVAIRGKTFDVAKLELYTFQFQGFDQPSVVRQLVQLSPTFLDGLSMKIPADLFCSRILSFSEHDSASSSAHYKRRF